MKRFIWWYLDAAFGDWGRYRTWRGGTWTSATEWDGAFRNMTIWRRQAPVKEKPPEDMNEFCISCEEDPEPGAPDYGNYKCPKSKRPCGHHCNHSWSHEECCWCELTFGPLEEVAQ